MGEEEDRKFERLIKNEKNEETVLINVTEGSENDFRTPEKVHDISISIEEAEEVLNDLYGTSWRINYEAVMRPLSERKARKELKAQAEEGYSATEKITKLDKANYGRNKLQPQKLNFHNLQLPADREETPWKKKLNGLVDSDTESSDEADEDEMSENEEYDKTIRELTLKRKSVMPVKKQLYTFLESLSDETPIDEGSFEARIYRTNFQAHKEQLAKKLFAIFNEKVFDNKLPKDMPIGWNKRLTKTAGKCRLKKNREGEKTCEIILSCKVLDCAWKLRDTLIHEMCHAATYLINGVKDSHGPFWRNWAFNAMDAIPELPPITRCHSYQINAKYSYKCTGCGQSISRHSKSLDTNRKVCGRCGERFECFINKIRKNGDKVCVKSVTKPRILSTETNREDIKMDLNKQFEKLLI